MSSSLMCLHNYDQQRYDTITALGASHMETPNIDRLADRGVVFEQCHITAPSCSVPYQSFWDITHIQMAFGQWTTPSYTWVSD